MKPSLKPVHFYRVSLGNSACVSASEGLRWSFDLEFEKRKEQKGDNQYLSVWAIHFYSLP